MQLNHARAVWDRDAPGPVAQSQQIALDEDLIERAAQALFEFVFSSCTRKHCWTNCDERAKEGFRGEAAAMIDVIWPLLLHKISRSFREISA